MGSSSGYEAEIALLGFLYVAERGHQYSTKGASIDDVPDGGVTLCIAAGGPIVARYTGRAGDRFICTVGKGVELYTDKLLHAVEGGAGKAERDAGGIDKMIEEKISYDTPSSPWRTADSGAPPLTPEQKHAIEDPIEMERPPTAVKAAGLSPPMPTKPSKRSINTPTPGSTTSSYTPGRQKRSLELFERGVAAGLRGWSQNVQLETAAHMHVIFFCDAEIVVLALCSPD